jgi:hypothetical protein
VKQVRHLRAGFFDLWIEQKIANPPWRQARSILAEPGRLPRGEAFRDSGRGVVAGDAIHFAEGDFAGDQGCAREGWKQEEKAKRPGEQTQSERDCASEASRSNVAKRPTLGNAYDAI